MNKKFLPLLLIFLSTAVFGLAQTNEQKEKEEKIEKKETITIRKKSDGNEKMTIVVDGKNITVNGKPIEDLKDLDIEINRNRDGGYRMSPKIKGRIAPMDNMRMFNEDILSNGNRAFLGVVTEKTEKGAKITTVEKESAAEKAGLKKEDIITKVGETKIANSDDLYAAIGKYKPEEKITISYVRDDKEVTVSAILGKNKSSEERVFNFKGKDFNFEMPELPNWNGNEFNFSRKPRLGLQIQDTEEAKGVKILGVDSNTPAAKSGLQKDDLIKEIDGKPISSTDDLRSKIKDLKEGDNITITFQRAGKTQTIEIKFPKKLKTVDL